MKRNIRKNIKTVIKKNEFLFYVPILLVLLAEILKPYVGMYFVEVLKAISLVLILLAGSFMLKKIPKFYLILLALLTIWLLLNSINTYSYKAVSEDGLRYMFPFLVTILGLVFSDNPRRLFKVLVGFVVVNDFFQIIIYLIYFIDVDLYVNLGLHYRNNQVYGIIRPSGITHSFDFFVFSNFIAYFLTDKLSLFKHDKFFKAFFLLFIFISTVFKYIFITILYLIIEKKIKHLAVLGLAILSVFIFNKKVFFDLRNGIEDRINLYLIDNNSMRSESLIFTYDYLLHHNPFKGEGVGTFGGPASIKHHSPFYEQNNLKWFDNFDTTTTDNFYPHLFIENGLFFGITYLLSILSLFIVYFKKIKRYWFLLFFILFVNFFNFSINTFIFQFYFFLLLYPLVYMKEKLF